MNPQLPYPTITFARITSLAILISFILLFNACKKGIEIPQVKKEEPSKEEPPLVVGLPKLFTDTISDLTNFSVTFRGQILDHGASTVTESGMVVDTIPNATVTKNFNKFIVSPDTSNQMKTIVTYVPAATTFYMRTYAINTVGTAYGNEIRFKSPDEKTTLESFTVSNQQEVIALGAKNYTSVQGLIITGTVTDLSPLKSLANVTAGMEIINTTALKDLSGLEHLEIIGSYFPNSLRIEKNRELVSLKGLNQLKMVRGYFYILNNPLLTNLIGLDSYTTTTAGEFRIENCANLRSLDGVESMLYCNGGLIIRRNPILNDLKALRNLRGVTEIRIAQNNILTNLNGLENITEYNSITVEYNPMLTNLDGLKNIKKCRSFSINENASLTNLSGFEGLSNLNYLEIVNNANLVNLKGLDNLTAITEYAKISGNTVLTSLTGLDQVEEIGSLEITLNNSLKDLTGLKGLKAITKGNGYAISIGHNENLISLGGLEQLTSSSDGIQIYDNKNLADFCALKLLFNTYEGYFSAEDNKIMMSKQILQSICK